MTVVDGWISIDEMELVASQMRNIGKTGTILEIGAAAGRLFSFLQPKFPNWTYVAVDPWEQEQVRLQIDWNKGYFDDNNLGEVITKDMFSKNCPFAEMHQAYFEDWNDERKFDIVSMGLVGKPIDWNRVYNKAKTLLNKDSVIIARNLKHKVYGEKIINAIESLGNIKVGEANGSAAYKIYYNNFGSHMIDLTVEKYKQEQLEYLDSDNVKFTGRNNFNKFCSVPVETKNELTDYFTKLMDHKYDWNFEYFHSGEPAGLHTDYTSFPNSWKPKADGVITHDCHIILGVIIPLDWNCKQPYTINYDIVSTIPRKLIYRKGEMRYQDNNEIYEYRKDYLFDDEVLKYNPEGTEYYKEYADLKFHSAYKWEVGTAMIFDTRRWHSSSWFIKQKMLPDVSTEYKRSIIGFASIDVDRL